MLGEIDGGEIDGTHGLFGVGVGTRLINLDGKLLGEIDGKMALLHTHTVNSALFLQHSTPQQLLQ